QLQVRVLRRRASLGEAREPLVAEGAQALDLLVVGRQLAPDDRVAVEAAPGGHLDQVGDRLLYERHALYPQPTALVGERALGDAPAVVDRAEEVLARHLD